MNKPVTEKQRTRGGPGGGPMGPGNMVPGEKAKNFKGSFARLVQYIGKYKGAVIAVILFAIASTIFSILGPKILGMATTSLFSDVMGMLDGSVSAINFGYIGQIILTLVVLYLVSAAFMYIQGFIMSGVAMKVTYNLRRDISTKINRLPLKYFDKKSYGEVLSYFTNDVDIISQSLSQSVTQIITSVTTFLGILIVMFTMSWQMTLIALGIIPVSFAIIALVVKKSQKQFTMQQEYLGDLNGHVEEMYGSHTLVKAFNGEKKSIEEFEDMNTKLHSSAWKSQFLSSLMMPIMNFISNLGYVAVCIFGGYLVASGSLPIGDIQAFIQYVRQFTQPLTQIANISNILQQTTAAAERVFSFLDEPEETPETSSPASTESVKGNVGFSNVRFGYDEDKIIIHDFTADIKQGQKVAIVGPTGAGKTTVIKLLMRFYELNGGSISLDDINIVDFKRNDLRSEFGMVLQDTWLYNATIRENIRYGRLSATDEEVVEAARAAQVDHFIRTLPQSYDTMIDEEISNISQGQKQLLTIARTILSNPKIMILDEATSSVDTRTEILIQKAMDNLMKGRTSFVIAHRLSTIRNADVIFVMNKGDIIEKGNHEELMAKGGFYANLYMSQFENLEEAAQA